MSKEKVKILEKRVVHYNDDDQMVSAHLMPLHKSASLSLLTEPDRITISSGEARNARKEQKGDEPSKRLDITGFKHLLMLILVVGNIKMLFADFYSFGVWDTLNHFGFGKDDLRMGFLISLSNFLYTPMALGIEVSASTKNHSLLRRYVGALHAAVAFTALVYGSVLTWQNVQHPLVATACEANVIVTFLKLVSFALTNKELRQGVENKLPLPKFYENGPIYPQNLTLGNIFYFWFAPTLIYQPIYPKRSRVRWKRVFSLLAELVMATVLFWVLMMQMAIPALSHFFENQESFPTMVEDYLSLCTIDMCLWLIGFFVLFQVALNLVAEVTRFGDRTFYQDWWNASSVGTFWRDWNLPVSNFFRRHLYTPLRANGCPKQIAANLVFLASAVLHELLFGIATHNFNGVAFMCMIVQPIFILATQPLENERGKGSTIGNCVMWVSMMLGQPTAVILYYEQWIGRNETMRTPTEWRYWIPSFHPTRK